ncbi:hypothetical protein ACS0TY_009920 [Phlomoides rotata]
MEKRDCIIEVTEKLKLETEASPDEPERWEKRSIYKIPVHAVNLNKEAYTPWVAAIGPYHHGVEQLRRMEDHKKRALRHFLGRSEKPLESYVEALAEVVHDLMDAYGHLDEDWKQDTKKFLQLMITDGCFILETMSADDQTINDYSPNDLIFSDHGKHNVIPCIKRDMLLLENQVPTLVLEKLLDVAQSGSIEKSENHVTQLILKFYGRSRTMRLGRCQHILDVYRKSMVKKVKEDQSTSTKQLHTEGSFNSISATQLKEAGIKFKRGRHERLKDIDFKGRTLKLPAISLDDTSESAFLNMVAFKRLHIGAGNEISSYIYFMNRLVSNERDVCLLKTERIISNAMGSDKAVAKLFLKLSKEILLDSDTWLDEVYINMDKKLGNIFGKHLFKWRYHLIHTYFRSPWAMLSVIAAALGIGLAITQAIYTVLSFIHRV